MEFGYKLKISKHYKSYLAQSDKQQEGKKCLVGAATAGAGAATIDIKEIKRCLATFIHVMVAERP